ncbi:MAG: hypothetical protein NXH75_14030, partial [Halobacteriovoraceae bacterium]|nr:hypothetical protein [Halobacteriovoraceae bacterium]
MKKLIKMTLFILVLSSVFADSKQQSLFNNYDKNQDKKISKDEWLSYHLKDFSHSDSKVAAKMKEMKDQMKT